MLFGALELFYSQGFHAVGLDAILTEVGVTKTTFYNHFQSRDHLVREAVEQRDAWDITAFGKRVQELGGYVPRDMLLAMFDVLDEVVQRRGISRMHVHQRVRRVPFHGPPRTPCRCPSRTP